MEVEVHVFGLVQKSVGFKRKRMIFEEQAKIRDVLRVLEVAINDRWLVIAVNDVIRSTRHELHDGDVITIHPICGGG